MDFGYMYAPNLIHQGASVITEILSAHGYKNSASSKQQWSHPWIWINTKTFKKGSKTIQSSEKLKGAMKTQGACTHAWNRNAEIVHMHTMHDCYRKKPCTWETTHLWEWSASHPLMVKLPSRFDTQIWIGFDRRVGQRPRNALNGLFSHHKAVKQ